MYMNMYSTNTDIVKLHVIFTSFKTIASNHYFPKLYIFSVEEAR